MLTEPHHIIAIGASAGGMEEINSFFDHTPLDGVSYIIVQHLSAEFKSRMLDLLSKHSKLEVKEAEDGMQIQCNEVYLIPNDKFMTIQNNHLHLTGKENIRGPHLTINTFFNSLAEDKGNKAIGIILSGLGTDGTEGIISIKKAGGMVIAQDPETTEFGSMPSNAIASGMVDFVLEPELMPDKIESYVKNEIDLMFNSKDDEKHLSDIINLIKEQSPLDFTDYKQTTILRRTKRRAAYSNFSTLASYIKFLKTNPHEVETLIQDFLISVTAFFRDKEAFDFIQNNVISGLLKSLAVDEELKIWVAGCATGEEAYSMAILVNEQLTGKYKNTVVKIFATDIDNYALVFAGKGAYSQETTKSISQERLDKYFIKEGITYKVNPEIRKMVIFAQHDLVKNPPYCNMHFISCRNLLIYMTPALQKKIFSMFLFGLKMDGYLFLGSSENPVPIIQSLEVINKKWKLYKNIEKKRVIRFDAFSLPDLKHKPAQFVRGNKGASNTLADTINETLVSNLNYQAICIDENNHVLKSYGDTSKYLLQKNFISDLPELLPKPLVVAFNTLRTKVLKTGKKSSVNGIKINHDDFVIKVTMTVYPLPARKEDPKNLLVIFNEDRSFNPVKVKDAEFDEKIYLDQYTRNLEDELRDLKDKLHSAHLQLDASNENMQSFNEELISANEEMQSSNEEMQSVNEELHTINSDYQLKNKELLELNDDLNNYFRSNINGQLFVNNDLLLMKFSPGTVKQINLLPTDVGRPLSHISTNIKFETFTADIEQVLLNGHIITKEIESLDGKWYQIMTMPYIRQTDNKIDGAIITFNDITELKNTQLELAKKNKSLLRINADLDNFVHTASHDLLTPLNNIEGSIVVMNKIERSNPDLTKFLNIINISIQKFRSLVKEIAEVAKIEADMISMEMVDLDDTIDNIEWSLDDKIKASGAVITRELNVKKVSFSKKNLRSIIYNLVSNGIKFTNLERPVINIKTATEGEYVVLSVEDNGVGIDKENADTIFHMYGRLNHEMEGQGIGLYLIKKIVDATGGHVLLESAPGSGSKFLIYLKTETEEVLA
ncbi:chemotaxis protein CheB [Pedobacter sp. P351]|uniref:chemotaxis protein CheB n=1 Tax=Pedobacter superstes TaxID=3133441 RepID=UPI0030AD3580